MTADEGLASQLDQFLDSSLADEPSIDALLQGVADSEWPRFLFNAGALLAEQLSAEDAQASGEVVTPDRDLVLRKLERLQAEHQRR